MVFAIQNAGLFLLAAPRSGDGAEGTSMVQTFVFMGLIFIVFWFFMIRPQRQKQKQREAMLKSLEKGDWIVTAGGIRGTVSKVTDATVVVKVDDNCKIEFSRSAVSEVVLDEDETARRKEALKGPKKSDVKEGAEAKTDKNDKQDKGEEGAL
ncbi:preprotein translocase subunit YajC [Candidatus Haliotispira prima]|uniref:Sec translocon accessory complex subunit YajC n=1 Tax=Candidatus Haliotispira prima TaxID=3034016 RepID=A0ABY8MGW4_9SPIO|nr:preprotein translocase subunit YajC [Candidatus Haliotispira prima]